jgi:hypothetical protein
MIGSRLKQLYTAYTAVKHANILRAARELSAPPPPNWRKLVKQPANLWLEWHFGWSPLFQDIYNGCQALSKPLPLLQRIAVHSTAREDVGLPIVTVDTGFVKKEISANFTALIRLAGYARLLSPSVGLADQLGLLNPIGVAWNLVPFSFLVDNVVNIGSFIDSYTDTIGWELSDVVTTSYRRYENGYLKTYKYTGSPGHYTYGSIYTGCFGFHITRGLASPGLPAWCLQLTNPFRDISVTRAATYCSLLLQSMSDYRRV